MHIPYPRVTQKSEYSTGAISEHVVPGVPDLESLSFEEAIRLFKQWGFQVEPGPRPEEITLILEGPDYRTCSVYNAHALSEIAAVVLSVRWRDATLACRRVKRSPWRAMPVWTC